MKEFKMARTEEELNYELPQIIRDKERETRTPWSWQTYDKNIVRVYNNEDEEDQFFIQVI